MNFLHFFQQFLWSGWPGEGFCFVRICSYRVLQMHIAGFSWVRFYDKVLKFNVVINAFITGKKQ